MRVEADEPVIRCGERQRPRACGLLARYERWTTPGYALEWGANGAVLLGDAAAAAPLADLYETVPPPALTRFLRAHGRRLCAFRAAAAGDEDAAADAFAQALAAARSLGRAGSLAPVLADYGAWLVETGRGNWLPGAGWSASRQSVRGRR
jgi:hypothetical protein